MTSNRRVELLHHPQVFPSSDLGLRAWYRA